ncbi:MarR family transcriptional regulator [Pseudodesulfovibrio nedwellii]|uniref:MarR family transcriptional regulator n=1 Tax=Pseudodesulfovibrio nedwellii TaxID=2973072 RepID=A0ABN6S5E5_9BACT|nr:MarR family transcriptional regulator [Pseudodesulfovibrio nedwellii]BDQ37248.1 MarR family transcriptional regulator [Pseudodesulfovibrio nedwellii]
MVSQEKTRMNVYSQLRRIIEKHTHIDEQPFTLNESIALSPREVRTIEFLGQSGNVNVTNVATHFNFTKSAASQLVNRLVKRGFISKNISKHSDKEFQLSLSPEGEKASQLIKSMTKQRLEMFLKMTERFSAQQIATTSEVLEQVESMVDERLKRFK